MAIEVTVEYEETYVKKGEPLRVQAPDATAIRMLDVRGVGDEMRYQYVIVWENGEVADEVSDDGAE